MIRGRISVNWWKAIADNPVDLSGPMPTERRFDRLLNWKQNLFTIFIQR